VLLILRDVETNRLIPVRWATIVVAERYGQIAFFEYLLGELIEYGSQENVQLEQIANHTSKFAEHHRWLPGTESATLSEPSVFKSSAGVGIATAPPEDLNAWGNVVSALATASIFHRIEFLNVVGLFTTDGERAAIRDESYRVRSGQVYHLKVIQYVPSAGTPGVDVLPGHAIEISTFKEHIIALRSKQQAVGKYDRLTFVLRVQNLSPGETTAIEIPNVPDAATENSAFTSIYLPVKVSRPTALTALALLLVLVASLVLLFKPELLPFPRDAVRNIATVVLVLTIAGPSRTLSGLWPSLPWRIDK